MAATFFGMKGCRPLTQHERQAVLEVCKNARERTLFVIGCSTGFRISELLSLHVRDVVDPSGKAHRYITVKGNHTKTGEGRTVVLNARAGRIVEEYVTNNGYSLEHPLFPSPRGGALRRWQAWRILKNLFARAGVHGATGTHSLRKTYAEQMYRLLDYRLEKLQKAMGHRSVSSTLAYLSFDESEINKAADKLEI